MTNRQWLLEQMQNMSDEELAKYLMVIDEIEEENGCEDIMCQCPECNPCIVRWLKAEHKEPIKLSDAERVILENVNKNYEWIARDEDGVLCLYQDEPCKIEGGDRWFSTDTYACSHWHTHLFQFIKWEDENPYNIEELLKGE